MIYTISNEDIFQVLSSSFSIGPSETGYELQVGADSRSFTTLFSVGANTPRMVTNVANGSYFRLKNNTGNVKVNWERVCSDDSGGGFDPSVLEPYWTSAQTKDYVDEAVSGISLDGYWTSAQTQSAITIVEDHLYDVEQVTASALTELHDGLMEVSGRTVDLSPYYTSAETEDAISAATSGKADKPLRETYPLAVSTLHINAMNYDLVLNGDYGQNIGDIWAPRSNGQAGQILVARGGQSSPVWSAMTFPTPDVDKAYVDSAITGVQDQLDVIDEVVSDALNDLNDRIVELSGSSVDLSAYYTSAQTEDAISAATSGKADAQNVTANNNKFYFPTWNSQGVIKGITGGEFYLKNISINGRGKNFVCYDFAGNLPAIYAPTTSGNPGEFLVADGTNTPKWSAVTFPDVSNYVTSAQVETQIVEKNYITSAATVNMVSSTSVSTIWKGTQAEYDAITTKDASTLYIIL